MALLPPLFNAQFLTDAGDVAAGHKLYTYESGTTNPKATYTTQAGNVENANPIVLDAAGRCNLWLGAGEYTFVLKTAADVTVWTRDDVAGVPETVSGSYLPLAGGTMTGAIVLPGNGSSALHAVPKQQLDAAISNLSSSLTTVIEGAVPVGTVALWLTGSPPSGWLHMNGQAVSRTTYASLFALWGTSFGGGDGSTTFNVPDVRGEFPRFWDASRGVDSGRAIGSAQEDQIEAHTHDGVLQEAATPYYINLNRIAGESDTWATGNNEGDTTGSSGGTETRPRNVAFMGICKAL